MESTSSSYLTPMMSEYVDTAGGNQATEYLRTQAEIEKQRRELERQKKKENSFWARMGRGATGAIPGAIAGAMTGNPAAIAGGAAAGFAGGALAPAGTNTAALGVMAAGMANRGSSYLTAPSVGNQQAPIALDKSGLQAPLNSTTNLPYGTPYSPNATNLNMFMSSMTPEERARLLGF